MVLLLHAIPPSSAFLLNAIVQGVAKAVIPLVSFANTIHRHIGNILPGNVQNDTHEPSVIEGVVLEVMLEVSRLVYSTLSASSTVLLLSSCFLHRPYSFCDMLCVGR